MNKEDAFKISLPKWPQMVVNGESISKKQALEIIRRTDSFFVNGFGGNNHSYDREVKRIIRYPSEEVYTDYSEFYTKVKEWEKNWGCIKGLEYLMNSWVSCSWIGGPHGWCHPDGMIAYCNNIGKWPEVKEVYNEWGIIAKEFPFLDLTCTLMNGEEDFATESLVSMYIHNGIVEFIDTIPIYKLEMNGIKVNSNNIFQILYNPFRENYFSLAQITMWTDEVYNKNKEE